MARPFRRKGGISGPQGRIRACTSRLLSFRFGEHYVLRRRRLFESAWPQRPLQQHLKVPVGFNEPIAKKGLGKLLAFRGGASSYGLVSGRRNGIGQRNSGFSQPPRPSWRSSFSVSGAKRRASVAVVAWSATEPPRATHVTQPHNGLWRIFRKARCQCSTSIPKSSQAFQFITINASSSLALPLQYSQSWPTSSPPFSAQSLTRSTAHSTL